MHEEIDKTWSPFTQDSRLTRQTVFRLSQIEYCLHETREEYRVYQDRGFSGRTPKVAVSRMMDDISNNEITG